MKIPTNADQHKQVLKRIEERIANTTLDEAIKILHETKAIIWSMDEPGFCPSALLYGGVEDLHRAIRVVEREFEKMKAGEQQE